MLFPWSTLKNSLSHKQKSKSKHLFLALSSHSRRLKYALLAGKQLGSQLCYKHQFLMRTDNEILKLCSTSRPKTRQRQQKVPTLCRGHAMNFKCSSLEQDAKAPLVTLYATGVTFRNAPSWDFDLFSSFENEEGCLTGKY